MSKEDEENGGFFPEPEEDILSKNIVDVQSLSLVLEQNDSCMYCKAVPIVFEIKKVFSILICKSCSKTDLKFITKTQCKSSYLLTEEELKEFKCLKRPNPHKGSWSDMALYLEKQIYDFSVKKHGDMSLIEKIKSERKEKTKNRKINKIKVKIKELRRKTFLKKKEEIHKHIFVAKGCYSECSCGMKIDEEII